MANVTQRYFLTDERRKTWVVEISFYERSMVDNQIENCPKCDTKLDEFPGVGLFCPNPDCDVVDNIFGNSMPRADRLETTEEIRDIPIGIAMNMAGSAECLVDDAEAYIAKPTEVNRRDLLASMRIMRHRIGKAIIELGLRE
jgi:CheY-like chemotaxis protein